MENTIVDRLSAAVLRAMDGPTSRPKAILISLFGYERLLSETKSPQKPIRLGDDMHNEALNLRFMNLPIYRSGDVGFEFLVI